MAKLVAKSVGPDAKYAKGDVSGGKATLQEEFVHARKCMNAGMIDREGEVDLVLTALLCRENPLLVGPPGTGKSMLLDALMKWMGASTKKFTILVNKFTTPEEVFGPISVQGLKNDEYRRVTTGKLPEADVAFVDEIFKASTAILNTMLRILNERVYDNGTGELETVPLKICVAASNEWPGEEGKELGALFDRFLLRKKVTPIRGRAARQKLLWRNEHKVDFEGQVITPAMLDLAFKEVLKMEFTEEAGDAVEAVLDELGKEGILPGDRRQVKSIRACKAFAYLNGADFVETEHLEILAHTLWDDPTEQPEKTAKVVAKVANPTGMAITGLLMQAEDVIAKATPAEAVPKLQEVAKQLGRMKDHPSKARATAYVQEEIARLYNAVLGRNVKE